MLKWCKVKKREGNAVLNGEDLGTKSPKVVAIIQTDKPKTKFKAVIVPTQQDNR